MDSLPESPYFPLLDFTSAYASLDDLSVNSVATLIGVLPTATESLTAVDARMSALANSTGSVHAAMTAATYPLEALNDRLSDILKPLDFVRDDRLIKAQAILGPYEALTTWAEQMAEAARRDIEKERLQKHWATFPNPIAANWPHCSTELQDFAPSPRPNKAQRRANDRRTRARQLDAEGKTRKEIARELGCK
jgi:hypothetical protein